MNVREGLESVASLIEQAGGVAAVRIGRRPLEGPADANDSPRAWIYPVSWADDELGSGDAPLPYRRRTLTYEVEVTARIATADDEPGLEQLVDAIAALVRDAEVGDTDLPALGGALRASFPRPRPNWSDHPELSVTLTGQFAYIVEAPTNYPVSFFPGTYFGADYFPGSYFPR